MSFRAAKLWLFYSKLEVSMVFSLASFSTFPLVSSFHDFWFLLDNNEHEKEKQENYSVDEEDHDDEDSHEEQEDR